MHTFWWCLVGFSEKLQEDAILLWCLSSPSIFRKISSVHLHLYTAWIHSQLHWQQEPRTRKRLLHCGRAVNSDRTEILLPCTQVAACAYRAEKFGPIKLIEWLESLKPPWVHYLKKNLCHIFHQLMGAKYPSQAPSRFAVYSRCTNFKSCPN